MQHLRTVLPRHDDCSTVGAMAASPDSRVLVVLDDAPFGATLVRNGNSKRTKSWNTAVT